MSGMTAVGGVGAALSQARIQADYQVRVLKEQQAATEDLGSAALELIQRALSFEPTQHDLDVTA